MIAGSARTSGDRKIGESGGDRVKLQPLLWADDAARCAGADHEAVGRLQLLQATLLADIAMILLIAAVKLDQHLIGLGQRAGGLVGQPFEQGPAQRATLRLDVFDRDGAHQYTSLL